MFGRKFTLSSLGDWSLITGRGKLQNGRGGGWRGQTEVLPLQKGGAEKVLAMLKFGGGGHKTS